MNGVDADSNIPYCSMCAIFYSLDAGEDYALLKLLSCYPFDDWPYCVADATCLPCCWTKGADKFHDIEDVDGLEGLNGRLLGHDFVDFLNRFESRKDYRARLKKEDDEDYQENLESLTNGALPNLLRNVCNGLKVEIPAFEERSRFLCLKALKQKGHFSLHAMKIPYGSTIWRFGPVGKSIRSRDRKNVWSPDVAKRWRIRYLRLCPWLYRRLAECAHCRRRTGRGRRRMPLRQGVFGCLAEGECLVSVY